MDPIAFGRFRHDFPTILVRSFVGLSAKGTPHIEANRHRPLWDSSVSDRPASPTDGVESKVITQFLRLCPVLFGFHPHSLLFIYTVSETFQHCTLEVRDLLHPTLKQLHQVSQNVLKVLWLELHGHRGRFAEPWLGPFGWTFLRRTFEPTICTTRVQFMLQSLSLSKSE